MRNLNLISLEGRYDNHIHCCPHINKRSLNIYDAIKDAEKEKMAAIGLMDNFSITSGYASLMKAICKNYKVKIFGGLIMEPYAGGVDPDNLQALIKYSYGFIELYLILKGTIKKGCIFIHPFMDH